MEIRITDADNRLIRKAINEVMRREELANMLSPLAIATSETLKGLKIVKSLHTVHPSLDLSVSDWQVLELWLSGLVLILQDIGSQTDFTVTTGWKLEESPLQCFQSLADLLRRHLLDVGTHLKMDIALTVRDVDALFFATHSQQMTFSDNSIFVGMIVPLCCPRVFEIREQLLGRRLNHVEFGAFLPLEHISSTLMFLNLYRHICAPQYQWDLQDFGHPRTSSINNLISKLYQGLQ